MRKSLPFIVIVLAFALSTASSAQGPKPAYEGTDLTVDRLGKVQMPKGIHMVISGTVPEGAGPFAFVHVKLTQERHGKSVSTFGVSRTGKLQQGDPWECHISSYGNKFFPGSVSADVYFWFEENWWTGVEGLDLILTGRPR